MQGFVRNPHATALDEVAGAARNTTFGCKKQAGRHAEGRAPTHSTLSKAAYTGFLRQITRDALLQLPAPPFDLYGCEETSCDARPDIGVIGSLSRHSSSRAVRPR
jgi:hypothetical protein